MEEKQDDAWRAEVEQQLKHLSREMADNTAVTTEVREILGAVRGGLKVLAVLGQVAKWAVPFVALAGAAASFWAQLKGGK